MPYTGLSRLYHLVAWIVLMLVLISKDWLPPCQAWHVTRQQFSMTKISLQPRRKGRASFALYSSSKKNTNDEDVSSEKDNTGNARDPEQTSRGLEGDEQMDIPAWILALRRWQPRRGPTDHNSETQGDPTLVPLSSNEFETNETSLSLPRLLDPILQSILNVTDLLPPFSATSAVARNNTSRNLLDLLDGSPADSTNDNTTVLAPASSLAQEMEAILDSLQDAALIVNVSSVVDASTTPPVTDWLDDGWNRWDRWMYSMQQSLSQVRGASNLTTAAEGILKQATGRLENLLSDVPPPTTIQSVLEVANATALAAAAAETLDINEAVERAQQLAKFAGQLGGVAEGLRRQGYVASSNKTGDSATQLSETNGTATTEKAAQSRRSRQGRALFDDFASATEIDQYTPILGQAAEMAALAGAVYEQTVPRSLQLGHSIVARGTSLDVKWMVTDSLASHSALELYNDRIDNDPSETPLLIRTITIRGFDASDEEVDRETLVTEVCTANAVPLQKNKRIKVHAGLWKIAKAIYKDIKQYIDWTTPQHKIVLNGHSIGGSLANLVLFLLTLDKGTEFVEERVLRVYTFGSPPVTALSESKTSSSSSNGSGDGSKRRKTSSSRVHCSVLESLGLPTNLVWAFVQPWDPIVRLFSDIDSLYPLVDGMMDPDADGITPWPKGPPRTLRPITKTIFEAWDGWPRFRDTYIETGSQSYVAVGIQHILLPDATRYLTDRFLTVSIAVPPVRSVLRVCPTEIYPALVAAFPLDVFEISYVPQAIRGFVHHFYPAYGFPLIEYVRLLEERAEPLLVRDNLATAWSAAELQGEMRESNKGSKEETSPWGLAGDWIQTTIPNRSRNTTATAK